MDIEVAFKEIEKWYNEVSYEIGQLTTEPIVDSSKFDQSRVFLSVVGYQHSIGDSGDSYEGCVYFEYAKGKFISTHFYM